MRSSNPKARKPLKFTTKRYRNEEQPQGKLKRRHQTTTTDKEVPRLQQMAMLMPIRPFIDRTVMGVTWRMGKEVIKLHYDKCVPMTVLEIITAYAMPNYWAAWNALNCGIKVTGYEPNVWEVRPWYRRGCSMRHWTNHDHKLHLRYRNESKIWTRMMHLFTGWHDEGKEHYPKPRV